MCGAAIERELERVDQVAINALGNADIIMVFPRVMAKKSKTRLVLKKPKTDTSIRTVWIPKTLALILREWRQRQEAWKEFMGEDYVDYNLVHAQENGRPCEDRIIGNAFARLKEKADLPDVVFHSLRHQYVKPTTKTFPEKDMVLDAKLRTQLNAQCRHNIRIHAQVNLTIAY